ncbi:hypothetical protein K503DRAFT_853553 [Rhizopogon vinicolor AM-OR11-026]|uniref:Uncharacterized protein n=1 Tax=Rhizopogon vinicolor AM-OR11-026 TaxID=1314800 RepID=A0A1B7NDZ3_9AGAM|nr:hypothetical protein K503DRAFT_853553 [Rhizopogon vinicolor AM-OR11-026]
MSPSKMPTQTYTTPSHSSAAISWAEGGINNWWLFLEYGRATSKDRNEVGSVKPDSTSDDVVLLIPPVGLEAYVVQLPITAVCKKVDTMSSIFDALSETAVESEGETTTPTAPMDTETKYNLHRRQGCSKISESLRPKTIAFEHYSINEKTKLSKKKGEDEGEENASHCVGSGSENTNSDDEDERPKKKSQQTCVEEPIRVMIDKSGEVKVEKLGTTRSAIVVSDNISSFSPVFNGQPSVPEVQTGLRYKASGKKEQIVGHLVIEYPIIAMEPA